MERAVQVLQALRTGDGGLRLKDLSLELGLAKSTLSGLLATLEESRLIQRDPVLRTFRLGPALVELGLAARAAPDLITLTRRELDWLSTVTGETAVLHAPSGDEAVIIDACESRHQLKVTAPVGHRLPALAGSVAKVLLAAAAEDALRAVTPGQLPAFTGRSVTDPHVYQRQLRLARQHGYATDDEEYLPGVRAASAPILDRTDSTVAVLTVVGPSSRLARARLPALGGHVRAAAARVSGSMGASSTGRAGSEVEQCGDGSSS